jgi:focal adhesion kinase 1
VKSATTRLQATSLSDSDDDEDDAYDDTVYPTWTVANPLVDDDEYDDVVGLAAGSDSPYDEPPDDEQSIYDVFEAKKYCYIPQQAVRITKLIGKGFFATVHMGVWDTGTKNIEIAVKRLNDNTDREYRVKFLQEAAIIGQFNHPHIIKLIGVIPEDKQLGVTCAIITELMPGGDLQKHLLDIQAKLLRREITAIGNVLLLYARQISAGMHYLSARKYIHRDLAARNVLLTAKHLCKIADFGLSRSLNDDIYYKSVDGIVSWKWTAPEVGV